MKRGRRTKVLAEGNPALLGRMSKQIEHNYALQIIRPPEKSLVMSQIKDSVSRQTFYLGEVLITECTVSLGTVYGFGAVRGENEEKAFQLAVVDAAYRANVPETEAWTKLLEQEEARILKRFADQHALSQRTRVRFDEMGRS